MLNVKCKNNPIEYVLTRNARKNINLCVKADGKIYISAPKKVTICEIERFISLKKDWIEEEQKKMKKLKIVKSNEEFRKRKTILYKGYEYDLVIEESEKDNVNIFGGTFYMGIKKEHIKDNEYIKKVFEKWTAENAKVTYDKLIDKFLISLEKYDVEKPRLQVRKMKSRWGSCIPSKKKITLNLNLMYTPTACAEYVVVHELSHLVVPNHSKKFYSLVEEVMPDWEKRKDILNKTFGVIV